MIYKVPYLTCADLIIYVNGDEITGLSANGHRESVLGLIQYTKVDATSVEEAIRKVGGREELNPVGRGGEAISRKPSLREEKPS